MSSRGLKLPVQRHSDWGLCGSSLFTFHWVTIYVSTSVLAGASSQAFPSLLYTVFQNLEEDLPMPFWKPRETSSPRHPRMAFIGHRLYRNVFMPLYSRFFLNNRKWGRFYCLGKGHFLIQATGQGLLINRYLISMQCFFVASITF